MDLQELRLIDSAVYELKRLRRENDRLSTRLQMFDDIMMIFRSRPQHEPMQGYSSDHLDGLEKILYVNKEKLQQAAIEELKAQQQERS